MSGLSKAETACFLIADISGYTSFLASVELEHAHDIISDLMGTLMKCLRPPFKLAKFEGDAAFVYAVTDKIDGSLLQDAVESAYFAFHKRLRDIRLATSCACSACSRMQSLDLKFVCHYGAFVRHKMAGREELAGRDVIVVHRFLKNAVSERFGGHAYVLYSDPCIRAMGIDPAAQGLLEHEESIDIIGDVKCWVRDLDQAWKEENARQRTEVTRDDAGLVLDFEIAAPRPLVWEHFTSPGQRSKWRAFDEVREAPRSGRRGVGTTNHCVHGPDVTVEEILDWRPFDYLTLTTLVPMPGATKILMTYAFMETPAGGTQIEIRLAKPKPKDEAFVERAGASFQKRITSEMEKLRHLLEADEERTERDSSNEYQICARSDS